MTEEVGSGGKGTAKWKHNEKDWSGAITVCGEFGQFTLPRHSLFGSTADSLNAGNPFFRIKNF